MTADITATLYRIPDLTNPIRRLSLSTHRKFQVAPSEPGAGEFTLPRVVTPSSTWSSIADSYPDLASTGLGVFVEADGLIYLGGGGAGVGWWSYDPDTDSYTALADAPHDLGWAATVHDSVTGRVIVLGSYTGFTMSYDIETDTWDDTLASAPIAVEYYPAYGVIGRKVYCAGGYTFGGGVEDSNQVYDLDLDTWATAAALPAPLAELGSCVLGGKLYAFGAWNDTVSAYAATALVFDPDADTWTPIERPALTVDNAGVPGVAALGSRILVSGGWGTGGRVATSWLFRPDVDFWTTIDDRPSADANRLVVAGGAAYSWGLDPPAATGAYRLALGDDTIDFAHREDFASEPNDLGQDLVAYDYKGERVGVLLIERWDIVEVARTRADERAVASGRGHGAVFARGLIYPAGGDNRQPKQDNRVLDWTDAAYDDSGGDWIDGVQVDGAAGVVGAAQVYWPIPFDPAFPDKDAQIIWDTGASFTDGTVGVILMRDGTSINIVTPGDYVFVVLIDNTGRVWLDADLIAGTGPPAMPLAGGFQQSTAVIVHLSAGTHLVTIEGTNFGDPPPNPGGVAWTLCVPSPVLSVVARSTAANTRMLVNPAAVPGMTDGQAIRVLVEEAQARGCFPYVTLGFTDTQDSAGNDWPADANPTARVGNDLLTYLDERSATHIDWRMDRESFRLDAWVKGGLGTASGVTLARDTNLTGLEFVRDL